MLSTIRIKLVALAAATLLVAIHVAPAADRDEYAQVQAKDLVKNPQMYWARGIVFKDSIVTPPSMVERKLGDRMVVPFQTKVAGECFADEAVVDALKTAGAGAQCIFSATIFQETFWFSKSRFRIVIQEFSVSATSATDIKATVSNIATSVGAYALVAQRLDSILSQIQSELMAYSGESGTPMSEILNPDGPHRERTMNSVRTAIARIEEEMRAPSSVFLTDLITALLAGQHGPAATKTAVEVAPTTPKADAPAIEKERETTLANPAPAPARAGFFSRLFGSGTQKQNKSAKPKTPKAEPAQSEPAKPSVAKVEIAGDLEPASTPTKRSFWSRIFGSSNKPVAKKSADSAPTAATPTPAVDTAPGR